MGKGKPIDTKSKDHFYARRRPNVQEGFYRLFVLKKKIAVEKLIECLEEYRLSNQTDIHHPWSKEFTLDQTTFHFDKFLTLVAAKTKVKFGDKRKQRKGKDGYDEWFQRGQLDGSFAYNGAADDF